MNILTKQPGTPCPACQSQVKLVNKNGETMYRLSSCQTWKNMLLTERAQLRETAKGCSLYTDWSGQHQKDNCDAKSSKGYPLRLCKEEVNGNPCGHKHHPFLHGSTVQYCNLIRGSHREGTARCEDCTFLNVVPRLIRKLTKASWKRVHLKMKSSDNQPGLLQMQNCPVLNSTGETRADRTVVL